MKAVFYCDGSSRPSGKYGGFGVYGYYFEITSKSKNSKHPIKPSLRFTDTGIGKETSGSPIEVTHIVEVIRAVNSQTCSNNEAEILAVLGALSKAYEQETLDEITIITDASVIVKAFNQDLEQWVKRGWKKQDGKTVNHLTEWQAIESYRYHFVSKGVKINLVWTKGHADSYGNIIADLFSVIASNASKQQLEVTNGAFVANILDRVLTFEEYKRSSDVKDLIYYFKDLYFSSNKTEQDFSYCFMSSSPDEKEEGRRHNEAIFATNIGYIPPLIEKIKTFYRSISRNYLTTCSIKLSKFENREILRLADSVPIKYLLLPQNQRRGNCFQLVDESGTFLQEKNVDFPFIREVTNLSELILDMSATDLSQHTNTPEFMVFDVTDRFVREGKLLLGNKDKFLDFTDLASESVVFKQRVLAATGFDFPAYLTLKRIEEEIHSVHLVLKRDPESNFYTLYVKITTNDRSLYSLNVLNKYLAFPVSTG